MTPSPNDPERPSPLLSVLVLNYNGLRHLEECLSSVRSQDFRDYEIVLADNASSDGSLDFVRDRFPEVRLVDTGANLGFAGGNNFGLRHCRGEYVFFLNNDTRLEPGALRKLAEGIRANLEYRVFACFMLSYRDPQIVDSAGDTLYTNGLVNNLSGYPASLFTRPRQVTSACGGAAVYARALLEEIGGFDEDFFLIYEDLDLSLRARHNGDRVLFLPTVRVLHKGSASIGGAFSPIAAYYYSRNYPLMMVQNFPAATLVKALPAYVLGFLYRMALSARHGVLGAYLRGACHGLRLLPTAIGKRRRIIGGSKIGRLEFESSMRPGWLRERLALRRGGTFVP
jgi:GT2 family glycosyltransferase